MVHTFLLNGARPHPVRFANNIYEFMSIMEGRGEEQRETSSPDFLIVQLYYFSELTGAYENFEGLGEKT